jgi:multicomponent Na+:H+ antiporter subunit B
VNRITVLVVALLGAVFVHASLDLPATGDPEAPAAVHVSPRYIEYAYQEMATKNMVCAVLADYRSFDTLGEVIVIVIGGLAIIMIFMGLKGPADES